MYLHVIYGPELSTKIIIALIHQFPAVHIVIRFHVTWIPLRNMKLLVGFFNLNLQKVLFSKLACITEIGLLIKDHIGPICPEPTY